MGLMLLMKLVRLMMMLMLMGGIDLHLKTFIRLCFVFTESRL